MKLKVGVAQIKNSINVIDNYQSIMRTLFRFSKDKELKPDIIVFPECSLSGFSSKIGECTFDAISSYLLEFEKWVRDNDCALVVPTALREKDKIFNTGFYLTPQETQRFYKTGLTESENSFFSVPNDYEKKIFTIKDSQFIPLICMEAQLEATLYFNPKDIDFILWPGYWGWEKEDVWASLSKDGEPNLIYKNMAIWSVPLIQANFSSNTFTEEGPKGLSVVIDSDNTMVFQGSYFKDQCFIVELENKKIKNTYSVS